MIILVSISDAPVNDNATYICKECESTFYEFDEMFEKVMERKAELSKKIQDARECVVIKLEPLDIKCEIESDDEIDSAQMETDEEELLLERNDIVTIEEDSEEIAAPATESKEIKTDMTEIKPNTTSDSSQIATHLSAIEAKMSGLNEKFDRVLDALKLNASNAFKTQDHLRSFENDLSVCKTFINNTLETTIGVKPPTYPRIIQSQNVDQLREINTALKTPENAQYFVSLVACYQISILRYSEIFSS